MNHSTIIIIQSWPKVLDTYIFFYLSGILLSVLFRIGY